MQVDAHTHTHTHTPCRIPPMNIKMHWITTTCNKRRFATYITFNIFTCSSIDMALQYKDTSQPISRMTFPIHLGNITTQFHASCYLCHHQFNGPVIELYDSTPVEQLYPQYTLPGNNNTIHCYMIEKYALSCYFIRHSILIWKLIVYKKFKNYWIKAQQPCHLYLVACISSLSHRVPAFLQSHW